MSAPSTANGLTSRRWLPPITQALQFYHGDGNCGLVMAGRLDFRRQAVA